MEFRQTLEHGAALLDLGQMEAQQLTDRRGLYRSVHDCLFKNKAIVGFEQLPRRSSLRAYPYRSLGITPMISRSAARGTACAGRASQCIPALRREGFRQAISRRKG